MSRVLRSALLLIAASSLAVSAETRMSYSATAFDLEGGEMLYVEKHIETWREGRLAERQVSYEDPAGEPIAEKLVRYGDAVEAPSFEMVDLRLGLREGADVLGERIVLYSGTVAQGERAGTHRQRTLDKPRAAVVDAGFDAFMRENFSTVVAGESLEFDFAVPALRRFFRFELQPQGDIVYEGEPALLIKMRPASAILRWLVDPIDLVYSQQGRLLEFRGLANVSDPQGERYEARIVFSYPPEAPTAALVGAAR